MMVSLLFVMLVQVLPCTPGETSVVCSCKQGNLSACMVLVEQDAEKSRELLEKVQGALRVLQAVAASGKESKEAEEERKKIEGIVEALGGAPSSEKAKTKPLAEDTRRVAEQTNVLPITNVDTKVGKRPCMHIESRGPGTGKPGGGAIECRYDCGGRILKLNFFGTPQTCVERTPTY